MTGRILVVDDEESIRDSLKKVLRAEGYEVSLAANGQDAIDQLTRESIDLLLLDIGLPLKDGWAILRWLAETTPQFPVIVITGRWKQGSLAEAAGADLLMEKPLDVPRLLESIRDFLQETPESRSRRCRDRQRHFRHIACNAADFYEELRKRATTPLSWGKVTDH